MSTSTIRLRPTAIGLAGWNVLLVLAASQTLAYFDRVNISVVGPVLLLHYHYTPALLGVLFSTFNWVYTFALLPSGPFVDWARARVAYPVCVTVWSVATMLCGVTTVFAPLAAFRALLGLGEGPMIPAGQRVIAETFPRERRAWAVGTFYAGNKIGLTLGFPLAAFLLHALGVSWVFYVTGVLGFVWIGWFLLAYRRPADVPVAAEEAAIHWGTLLRYRKTWAIMLGQGGYLYIYYVFANWLPTYLVLQRHMTVLKGGFVATLPFFCGVIATLVGGWASDRLVARGSRVSVARKTFAVGGLLLATLFTVLAAYSSGTWGAVTFLTLAVVGFSLSTASIQSIPVDIAPPHVVASLVSLATFGANLGASFAPVITGLLISKVGNFQLPLLVAAAVALVGSGSYAFLVGNLDQRLTAPAR